MELSGIHPLWCDCACPGSVPPLHRWFPQSFQGDLCESVLCPIPFTPLPLCPPFCTRALFLKCKSQSATPSLCGRMKQASWQVTPSPSPRLPFLTCLPSYTHCGPSCPQISTLPVSFIHSTSVDREPPLCPDAVPDPREVPGNKCPCLPGASTPRGDFRPPRAVTAVSSLTALQPGGQGHSREPGLLAQAFTSW